MAETKIRIVVRRRWVGPGRPRLLLAHYSLADSEETLCGEDARPLHDPINLDEGEETMPLCPDCRDDERAKHLLSRKRRRGR